MPIQNDDPYDKLVPDPEVWEEFGITSMTGWRYTNDLDLGFPPPIKIRRRNFRSRRQIEEFKKRLLQRALAKQEAV